MARKSRHKAPLKPRHAHHAALAAEKFAAARFADAAKYCRRALAADPTAADLWHLLAAALLSTQKTQPALEAAERCLRLAPDSAQYRNTHALILDAAGHHQDAEKHLAALVEQHPDSTDGWYNLGRLLLRRAEFAGALSCFSRVRSLKPDWNDALKNLGHACYGLKHIEAAEQAFLEAHAVDGNDPETLINLGRICQHQDNYEQAVQWFRLAVEASPDTATLLRLALLRPIFCEDAAAIDAHRERIGSDLATIARESLSLSDPASLLGAPLFYFAYHGRNDRDLSAAFGDIVHKAWQPVALPAIHRRRHRPRVAFVSAHFKRHAIGRLYAPLMERLSGGEFELASMSLGQHDDDIATRINAAADVPVAVPDNHDQARRALHELDADLIFFPDVGMEATGFWLAAERHARVQCMGWGHPVTSGLRTMDYFISSRWLEPPDAAAHYRESLVELLTWPVAYDNPGDPAAEVADRSALGVAAHERIYLCPQSLFKLHPDFDQYLGAILRLDDAARIVLIGSNVAWRTRLSRRFAGSLGELASRITFLPAQSSDAFYALLQAADVVLDTIHFSGGVTSFETIWSETPFVTERGDYMRGRVTAGLCDLLELDYPVADGPEDYATRAVTLAAAGPERTRCIDHLRGHKHQLLEFGDAVAAAYSDFFGRALEDAEPRVGDIAS